MQFFNFLLNAGPTVMLPVIITIIGLIFGLKFTKAFKSGLTLAIGFAGIKLVINFMSTNLGPAAQAMVKHLGVKLDALDVGWGSIAAVTWSSPIIAILIFAIFAVNMLMLVLKATKTLDVDIWNYHHMAIVGVMVYFVTHNIFLGVAASVTMAITTFKIADWSAPLVERFFGIPGVTLPTVSALSSLVIAWPLNWLLDCIPGINKIKFSVRDAQKYLGFFGDQMILGLLMGFVIGLLARYDIIKSFELGVNMAAVLILIPKMTSLFMEGLMPISEAAKGFTQKYFKGRELFIGLDAAVVVGNPDVITTALILIPLTIFMSVVLPGNRVLPFADLAVIPFRVAMVVALTRGNLFKNLIIGLVTTASLLYFGTFTAPILTEVAQTVGIDLAIAGGAIMISSFASTSMVQSFLVFMAFTGNLMITMPIMILVIAASWYYFDIIQPRVKKVTDEKVTVTDSPNRM
ncbi:PTS galactitol transporter subunit IIC [Streptococcus cuniculi]|uniref:PTS galactitol transporter subunit IIC n=1 Tax=Streptococcus cuniculi TaxID=1432788 RepID=A0A1Q8E813_9STRE|nr:PTS transporter subunit IIC [Streptococcus cuniculi]OLF47920.1 PTS galactitol transporter subunit IIC [Streptococcus cuniculi]